MIRAAVPQQGWTFRCSWELWFERTRLWNRVKVTQWPDCEWWPKQERGWAVVNQKSAGKSLAVSAKGSEMWNCENWKQILIWKTFWLWRWQRWRWCWRWCRRRWWRWWWRCWRRWHSRERLLPDKAEWTMAEALARNKVIFFIIDCFYHLEKKFNVKLSCSICGD